MKNFLRNATLSILLGSLVFGSCVVVAFALFPPDEYETPAFAETAKMPDHVPAEVIVKFKPASEIAKQAYRAPSPEERDGIVKSHPILSSYEIAEVDRVFKSVKPPEQHRLSSPAEGAATAKIPELYNVYRIRFQDETVSIKNLLSKLNRDPEVEYAEPNYIATATR